MAWLRWPVQLFLWYFSIISNFSFISCLFHSYFSFLTYFSNVSQIFIISQLYFPVILVKLWIYPLYLVEAGALKTWGSVCHCNKLFKKLWKGAWFFTPELPTTNMQRIFHPWHKGVQNHGAVTIDDSCLIDWVAIIPYTGNTWRGKILANLANSYNSPNFYPPNVLVLLSK